MTTCSCCGEEQNRHVALQCHDDIKICPGSATVPVALLRKADR